MKTARITVVGTALAITIASGPQALAQGKNPPGVNPTHFQCYEVADENSRDFEKRRDFKQKPVKLRDQFGASGKTIMKAAFLCAPVLQKDEARYQDQTTHLVCYVVEPSDLKRKVRIQNQFGQEDLTLGSSKILCVPSRKTLIQ